MTPYLRLENIFKEISNIEGALEILNWDSAAVMPDGGAEARADQLATLMTIGHSKLISPEIADYLDAAEANIPNLDDWQRANLDLMRHEWKHATAVDSKLVAALSKAGSACEMVWREARHNNDFASYEPLQQEVLNLVREVAVAKSEAFSCSKYDALLDQFDAGRTSAQIDIIFGDLEKFLPDFIQQVIAKQASDTPPLPLYPPFPIEKQKQLGLIFMKDLGFDFNHGRLDVSHHPFCGGGSDDVRITTRYDVNDFTSAMMGILHETGHALYEQGLPKKYRGQPVGNALGMSIHESQSLLIEMQVCRGQNFLEYATPIIAETFDMIGDEIRFSNLKKIYNRVEPGFIRVDADEVTYPAHVMLRYRLETALINGEMEIKDVPDAWNKMMKKLLNVDVPDYAHGCMQDIHWTDGSFGYFPTYTLGAIHAAQFYNKAKIDNPEIEDSIKLGNFEPLITWLRKNIHTKGSKLSANDLLSSVTGEDLNVKIFEEHLRSRYL